MQRFLGMENDSRRKEVTAFAAPWGYISPQCGLNGIRAAHQNGVLAEYRAPVGRKSPNFARCKAILRRTRSIYEGGIDGENTKIYGPYAAGPV